MPHVFVGLPSSEQQIKVLSTLLKSVPGLDTSSYEDDTERILTCFAENVSQLFGPDKDSHFLSDFCSLLQRLPEDKQISITDQCVKSIISDQERFTKKRLTALNYLYNFFPVNSQYRCELFLAILKYSKASGNVFCVLSIFPSIENLFTEWRISVEKKREVYKEMYEVRKVDSNSPKQTYHLLRRCLITYEGCSGEELKGSLPLAVDAAVQAIKLEGIHQFDDLIELSAVKQLQNDEKYSKLYELLSLFAGEKLESFDTFTEKYPDYLESLGLQREDCLRKIRLLSLTTLAAENNQLIYSQIAKTLNIAEDEVESWVIFAVAAQLIDAKLDQINQTVFVQHYTQRMFADQQWKQLQQTLNTWKGNVQELLTILESSGGVSNFVTES